MFTVSSENCCEYHYGIGNASWINNKEALNISQRQRNKLKDIVIFHKFKILLSSLPDKK